MWETSSRRRSVTANPSNTTVARTEGYTYAVKVWALSFVHEPISVAPWQLDPTVTIRNFSRRCLEV
jgi:hypothetical protein